MRSTGSSEKEEDALDGGVDNLLREVIRADISRDANSVASCCLDIIDDGRQAFLVNASPERLGNQRLKVLQKATARTRLLRPSHLLLQREALCSCQFPGNTTVMCMSETNDIYHTWPAPVMMATSPASKPRPWVLVRCPDT